MPALPAIRRTPGSRGRRRGALVVGLLVLAGCGAATDARDPVAVAVGTTESNSTIGSLGPVSSAAVVPSETAGSSTASPSSVTAPPETPAPTPPSPEATPGTSDALPAVPPPPTGLRIPSIGVDEQLIDLGLTADGGAEVPQDYDRAGWYSPGGRPGAVGPTVLLGHVDSTTGPAVFFRLRELTVGDEVEVTTADGDTARYAVVSLDDYGKDDFPTFEVFGATLDDVLKLVTCGGEFDRSVGSYTDNLVVTAARVA